MKTSKLALAVVLTFSVILLSGCTDWKKKYQTTNAELENLKALFDRTSAALSDCERDKSGLQRQLASQPKPQPKSALEEMGGKYDAAKGTITVTLDSNVLFNSGKVDLKQDSKSSLQRISSIVKRDYPGKEVWVMGHTDTDPIKKSKWKDNWELSSQRALSVVRYLVSQGIDAKNMVAAGRGEYHPISQSKAANRRVEIIVYTR